MSETEDETYDSVSDDSKTASKSKTATKSKTSSKAATATKTAKTKTTSAVAVAGNSTDTFVVTPIDNLTSKGIAAADVTKLKEAGIQTL